MIEFFTPFVVRIHEVLIVAVPSTVAFAVVFAALTPFPSLACNPGRPWWRNPGLVTDLCYCFVLPFFIPYMRLVLLILGAAWIGWVFGMRNFGETLAQGYGPIGRLPLWTQMVLYLVLSDCLMYWIHRLFHGRRMWRYHAIHHSAAEVDWTTAYRFHPINLWLDAYLVDSIMMFIGIPTVAIALLAPLNSVTSAYVHANLNWTLGPLKYVFASPVFHRWHHTTPEQGGDMNFGSTFSLWDVLFGTFYMPEGELPQTYGVSDPNLPQTFVGQLVYPFRNQDSVLDATTPASLRRQ